MAQLPWIVGLAIVARWAAQLFLARLNAAEVRRNRGTVPPVFRDVMDDNEYRKAGDYTLAKNRFGQVENTWDAVLLALILFTGLLPFLWRTWTESMGQGAWSGALFLMVVSMALSLPGLPLEWWEQFRLEERFGFNRSTLGLWLTDKLKGALIGLLIGFPLMWLLLKLVDWIGAWWWLVGWGIFFGFQLLMLVLYPMLVLPWFNKLTPLPDGETRERLMALADRAKFHAKTIQVMDGSKRSAHSNAFFTGFGRFRRIVLFDTLLEQLGIDELEAVLAHEIGHYKLGHIPKMLAFSAATTLAMFALVGWLARSPAFFHAFGFAEPHLAIAFLLFLLVGSVFGFWFGPLGHLLSRRHEYEADAFARNVSGAADGLIAALRKLSRKNLTNLTPHPVFSAFYYSHPTLAEREAALRAAT